MRYLSYVYALIHLLHPIIFAVMYGSNVCGFLLKGIYAGDCLFMCGLSVAFNMKSMLVL